MLAAMRKKRWLRLPDGNGDNGGNGGNGIAAALQAGACAGVVCAKGEDLEYAVLPVWNNQPTPTNFTYPIDFIDKIVQPPRVSDPPAILKLISACRCVQI